jgi:succinyl-CoA synthetase beta subunit
MFHRSIAAALQRRDADPSAHAVAGSMGVIVTVNGTIWVMASGSGSNVPNWDIRDEFPNEGTMLVVNDDTGQSLARNIGAGRVYLCAAMARSSRRAISKPP